MLRAEGDVEKLAADYVALHRELTNRSRALNFLRPGIGAVPAELRAWNVAADWRDLPGAKPWRDAVAALATDADAALPA